MFAQNVIKVTVTDTKSTSIPFANIVLQSKTDSLLFSGVTTDMDGRFVLNFNGNMQDFFVHMVTFSKAKICSGFFEVQS